MIVNVSEKFIEIKKEGLIIDKGLIKSPQPHQQAGEIS